MNQINPLHIGALLITVLVFLFFKLSTMQTELAEVKEEYAKSKKTAIELHALENIYGDKKKINASIQRLLRQPSLKSAKIKKELKKDSFKISSDTLNANALNSLMGKILNGTYKIAAFDIKKQNSNQASLKMEIKW
ncbi:MAG: hypothetical protein ABXS93_05345 [Sulfurimonas sp.]